MNQQKMSRGWLIAVIAVVVACLCLGVVSVGLIAAGALSRGLDLFTGPGASLEVSTAPQEEPRPSGGTLRLVGGEPITLDPALVEDSTSAEYVDKLFVGLVSLDKELQVRPELAEAWDITSDGTVYTFHLRSDARFQDGRTIMAEDVSYSLNRSCAPETASQVAGLYLGDIVGVGDRLAGRSDHIVGVEVIDDRTIRITIDAPKSYFLAKLTYSTAAVVDRYDIEGGADWTDRPNGSGPYRLANRSDEEILLEASATYFRGKPRIERIQFLLGAGDPMTMYETGEIDAVPVGLDDIERVQDPTNSLHDELMEIPSLNVQYVGLNTRLAPFDDSRVRQAFFYATDRRAITDVLLKKSVQVARGILPPGLPGYKAGDPDLSYNPERARSALAESRYGDADQLPSITLVSSLGNTAIAEALAAMYAEVLGVEIVIEQVEWRDFLRDLNEGRYQMFILGWNADYPDPQDFLDIQFHSDSGGNNTGYANQRVDQLLEAARVEQNPETRFDLYQRAEDMILSEAPWIPLYHGIDYVLIKPYVHGFFLTPQGMYNVEDAYLEAP